MSAKLPFTVPYFTPSIDHFKPGIGYHWLCNVRFSEDLHLYVVYLYSLTPLLSRSHYIAIHNKKSQDYVKIVGFYRPSHSRPILTPGIQICSQKWSQVNISIGYSYISQVKILYKVKFSKLEICQSDCRFKILAKNCVKKVSFFFQNFD